MNQDIAGHIDSIDHLPRGGLSPLRGGIREVTQLLQAVVK
jgi:hypothetical protein